MLPLNTGSHQELVSDVSAQALHRQELVIFSFWYNSLGEDEQHVLSFPAVWVGALQVLQ